MDWRAERLLTSKDEASWNAPSSSCIDWRRGNPMIHIQIRSYRLERIWKLDRNIPFPSEWTLAKGDCAVQKNGNQRTHSPVSEWTWVWNSSQFDRNRLSFHYTMVPSAVRRSSVFQSLSSPIHSNHPNQSVESVWSTCPQSSLLFNYTPSWMSTILVDCCDTARFDSIDYSPRCECCNTRSCQEHMSKW